MSVIQQRAKCTRSYIPNPFAHTQIYRLARQLDGVKNSIVIQIAKICTLGQAFTLINYRSWITHHTRSDHLKTRSPYNEEIIHTCIN